MHGYYCNFTNIFASINLRNLFTQVSVNAVISLGMTFVILTGGIDLSVGSVFNPKQSFLCNTKGRAEAKS